MNDRPLVSVVIPVFNGERYLSTAIDSVIAQSYPRLEIVAIDDGSTDSSPLILSSYGSRIISLRQENAGVSRARNCGIIVSRGDFIAFLDQDDWWLHEKIQKQIKCFLDNPHLGLVHTNTRHYNDVSGQYVRRLCPVRPELLSGDCFEQLLLGNGITNSSVMVPRSVLNTVGTLDISIPGNTLQDYELWLRIARMYPFAYLPEPLTVYRLHPAQGIWNVCEMLKAEIEMMRKLLGEPRKLKSARQRERIAELLDSLGIQHLDAGRLPEARRAFFRSFRTCASWRDAVLCLLSFLPIRILTLIRGTKARVYAQKDTSLPVWTDLGH
jgi:hypothetical protein